ncbi:MAG: peptidylprolyl isomerase [Bacteroidetes bacterium]|nr:peptidylprolyl isomerase [Bacteroidota bacterium]
MKRACFLGVLLCSIVFIHSCKKKDTATPDPGPTTYELVELTTKFGTMTIWLYEETPLHKANFLKLSKNGFYDGTTFHRLVSQFVAQGGDPNSKDNDPTNDGFGGPGYTIPAEIKSDLHHVRGAIGAARDNNPAKESNGSQFYIVVASNSNTAGLDGNYTVFGYVIDNIEATDQMMAVPYDKNGRPLTDIPMTMKVISKTKEAIKADYGYDIPQ